MNKVLSSILIIGAMLSLSACGGGGGNDSVISDTTIDGSGTPENTVGDPQNNPPASNVIELIPNEASAEINANNPVDVTSTEVISQDPQKMVLAKDVSVSIDRPLFLDGFYQGMIASVEINTDNTITVTFREAKDLAEIIDTFSIEVDTSESVISSNKNGSPTQKLSLSNVSLYDKQNTKKMSYSLLNVNTKSTEGKNEPVLRINIPAGYHIPVAGKNSKVDCDTWEAECVATFGEEIGSRLDLGDTITQNGITFSTEESYVEVGLGMSMAIFTDINYNEDDILNFTLVESAYFESNLSMSIEGNLSAGFESKAIPLTKKITVNIPVYGKVASVDVVFQPYLIIGANGEITGKLVFSSYTKREGAFILQFDSETDGENAVAPSTDERLIRFTPAPIDENGIEVQIDANGEAFATAGIKMTPSVSLASVMDINIGDIRGMVRANTKIEGEIDIGLEVANDEASANFDSTAKLQVTTYPMIDYKLNIGIDPIGLAPISFYNQNKYTILYQGADITIFDWEASLLDDPQIIQPQEVVPDTNCSIYSEEGCIVYQYYESGAIQSETPFINGVVDGISISYYESGAIETEIPLSNGVIEGIFKLYYESGAIQFEIPYVNGVKEGTAKAYYESGELWYEETYVNGVKVS